MSEYTEETVEKSIWKMAGVQEIVPNAVGAFSWDDPEALRRLSVVVSKGKSIFGSRAFAVGLGDQREGHTVEPAGGMVARYGWTGKLLCGVVILGGQSILVSSRMSAGLAAELDGKVIGTYGGRKRSRPWRSSFDEWEVSGGPHLRLAYPWVYVHGKAVQAYVRGREPKVLELGIRGRARTVERGPRGAGPPLSFSMLFRDVDLIEMMNGCRGDPIWASEDVDVLFDTLSREGRMIATIAVLWGTMSLIRNTG
jgi:hypothetical protein